MIGQSYIAQLEKQFQNYLKDITAERPFTPIVLRGGKNRPQTTVELHKMIETFRLHDKSVHGRGRHIEWETWSSKRLSVQQWPATVSVVTEDDYLFLTAKESLSQQFKKQLAQLISWKAAIREFLYHKPYWVLEFATEWKGICAVTDYLLENEVKNHYIRSLPVPVHTKFIQTYRLPISSLLQFFAPERFASPGKELEEMLGLKRKPVLFTMKWLDPDAADSFTAGLDILALPIDQLRRARWQVQRIILVENETNLYLLPAIADTLAIFSAGKALHLLKEIPLFNRSEIFYWGDLDEEGFKMLNSIRSYYPHAHSLLMDDETVSFHQTEIGSQPSPYKTRELDLLTAPEAQALAKMHLYNGRIEQEKLQQEYVVNRLAEIFNGKILP